MRDLQAVTTELVSRGGGPGGSAGNGPSAEASISSDGRFVAFDSRASNLTAADNDSVYDVFVRDRLAATTTLASRADGPSGAKGNGPSGGFDDGFSFIDFIPSSISGDGRFVTFSSAASNLDPADADAGHDVYVRDTHNGTTTLASQAAGPSGTTGNGLSVGSALSANGLWLVFASGASNLHPDDADASYDLFMRDMSDPPPAPALPAPFTPAAPATAAAPAPAPPPAAAGAIGRARIGTGSPGTVRVNRGGTVRLARPRVTCPSEPPACRVTTTVKSHRSARTTLRLGGSRFSLAPTGKAASVRLRLDARAMRLLRRVRRLSATVRIVATHGDQVTTKTVRVRLLRPRSAFA